MDKRTQITVCSKTSNACKRTKAKQNWSWRTRASVLTLVSLNGRFFISSKSKENCRLACPRNYDPVCGWDGRSENTYANECEFKREVCLGKKLNLIVTRRMACTHENL